MVNHPNQNKSRTTYDLGAGVTATIREANGFRNITIQTAVDRVDLSAESTAKLKAIFNEMDAASLA